MMKLTKVIITLLCLMLFLSSCNNSNSTSTLDDRTDSDNKKTDQEDEDQEEDQKDDPKDEDENDQGKGFWLISIEQTNNETYMGSLGDGSIPTENTILFVAVNDNESPYEGEFRGYATINSFTDWKAALGVDNAAYLESKTEHSSEVFTFQLVSTGLASLTRDKTVDPLLEDSAKADFLMPTKGANPASVEGSVEGIPIAVGSNLDFALTCSITQLNSEVTLETDMFGTFTGTIEKLYDKEDAELDLAPLTQ